MANQLISCDDHMDLGQLPEDLWTTRLPPALRDRAPHIEERDGQAVWICDGKVWGSWGGKPPATGNQRPVKPLYNSFDRAGIYDQSERRPAVAELRLADMDRDGVQTQVIFGPIFQISTDDPVLRVACYRVYNDWLLDFCKAAPDRLLGVPMLPETPAGATEELLRLAAKGGVRQVTLMIANINPKLDDPAWEKLWTRARRDRDHPLLAHYRVSAIATRAPPARRRACSRTPNSSWRISSNRLSICSPGASSNAIRSSKSSSPRAAPAGCRGSSQELDYRHWRLWEAKEFWADKGGAELETKPSELFKRQIWATFQEDYAAMSLIPFFGEGHLLWASDYPHPDGVWPNSRAAIERQMASLSPEMRRKLTHDNAAKLYGLN